MHAGDSPLPQSADGTNDRTHVCCPVTLSMARAVGCTLYDEVVCVASCELLWDGMRAAAERNAAGGQLDAVQHVVGHLGI
jgi:hypothetical protein